MQPFMLAKHPIWKNDFGNIQRVPTKLRTHFRAGQLNLYGMSWHTVVRMPLHWSASSKNGQQQKKGL